MKKNKLWFTLVELLVVITILAIISVVAYQNFGWAVDKAISGRKISDVSTIETALQQYKTDKNYYPNADIYSWSTNLWWYKASDDALKTNTLKVQKNWDEITWVVKSDCKWWWKITNTSSNQIWAKGTISQEKLEKKYLSKDLYDPEIWDIKVWNWKMIDYWLWRYIYAVYKNSHAWSSDNLTWNAYNMAYTIRKDWSDSYVTKIVWDYDEKSCFDASSTCPATLIWLWWTGKDVLNDWDETWIPYPVTDFPSS